MQVIYFIVLIYGLYGDVYNLDVVKLEFFVFVDFEIFNIFDKGVSGVEKYNRCIYNERLKKRMEIVVYLFKFIKGVYIWDGIDVCVY